MNHLNNKLFTSAGFAQFRQNLVSSSVSDFRVFGILRVVEMGRYVEFKKYLRRQLLGFNHPHPFKPEKKNEEV